MNNNGVAQILECANVFDFLIVIMKLIEIFEENCITLVFIHNRVPLSTGQIK